MQAPRANVNKPFTVVIYSKSKVFLSFYVVNNKTMVITVEWQKATVQSFVTVAHDNTIVIYRGILTLE